MNSSSPLRPAARYDKIEKRKARARLSSKVIDCYMTTAVTSANGSYAK